VLRLRDDDAQEREFAAFAGDLRTARALLAESDQPTAAVLAGR
jgi:hypothetical protein